MKILLVEDEKPLAESILRFLKEDGYVCEWAKDYPSGDEKVGMYVPDKIVNECILVELKAKPFLTKQDIDQFWKYLRGSEYKLGFLVNFAPARLEIKRIVYEKARHLKESQR